jgi:beta-lactam-binding protein with PASTA domain
MVVCIFVISALVVVVLVNISGPTRNVSVPNLIGKSETRGLSIAKKDGLQVKLIYVHRTSLSPPHIDSVVAQYPTPGTHVSAGSRIQLTVYNP